MGMVKDPGHLGAPVVSFSPELIQKVRQRICHHIALLGGLSLSDAERLFDQSIVAVNLQRRPGPVVHEDPEYVAELVLEKAGILR